MPSHRSSVISIIAAALLLLVVGLALFPVSGTDDKYITYWAARSLALTGEITNFNGARVEQSSSLAHVVLLAGAIRLLPFSVPTVGWLLSIAFGLALLPLTATLARRIDTRLEPAATLVTASATSFVYWTYGGLESTLAACVAVLLVLQWMSVLRQGTSPGRIASAGAVSLVFAAVRPEGALVGLAALTGTLLVAWIAGALDDMPSTSRSTVTGRLALLGGLLALSVAVLVAFRWVYFGDVVPQPVHAKVGSYSLTTLKNGVKYVFIDTAARGDLLLWPLAIAAGALCLWRAVTRRRRTVGEVLVVAFLAATLGFVICSGGDWMEAGRFLVPAVPFAAIMATTGLLLSVRAPQIRTALVTVVVVMQVGSSLIVARTVSSSTPIWLTARQSDEDRAEAVRLGAGWVDRMNRIHRHLIPLAAGLLTVAEEAGPSRRLTAFGGQMGFIPYYVALLRPDAFRFVDKGGLVTRDVTDDRSFEARHSRTGANYPYPRLFALIASGTATEDWIPPDVIFDYEVTGGPQANRIPGSRANGYDIAFLQTGFPMNGSSLFPGQTERRSAFIATRGGLLQSAPVTFHFSR